MVSGYRQMWVMVMFDLPVGTKVERRNYTRFRKKLLSKGFWQLQYSVYARPCISDDTGETYRANVEKWLPPHGHVRIILFTDKQFGRMQCFTSRKKQNPEEHPEQLSFF